MTIIHIIKVILIVKLAWVNRLLNIKLKLSISLLSSTDFLVEYIMLNIFSCYIHTSCEITNCKNFEKTIKY